jgi:hypothetical protein
VEMTRQDVIRIYRLLATHGIKVWVDGGFCVDALVARATREHADLDIAVERGHAERQRKTSLMWRHSRTIPGLPGNLTYRERRLVPAQAQTVVDFHNDQ